LPRATSDGCDGCAARVQLQSKFKNEGVSYFEKQFQLVFLRCKIKKALFNFVWLIKETRKQKWIKYKINVIHNFFIYLCAYSLAQNQL
jgi:hypothetical protein